MKIPSFDLPKPTFSGATVTERERQMENYIIVLLKQLEWAMNTITRIEEDHEARITTLEE